MKIFKAGGRLAERVRKNWKEGRQVLKSAREEGGAFLPLVSRLLWMYGVRRFSLREMAGYDLLHPATPIPALVSKQESLGYLKKANPLGHACLTENKIIFDAVCAARGLAVPKCPAFFVHGKAMSPNLYSDKAYGAEAEIDFPDEFIFKPADGSYGQFVSVWRRDGDCWTRSSGEGRYTARQLVHHFTDESRRRPWIVQERIRSHSEIAQLSGFDAVQTLRLISLRDANNDGQVDLLFGSLKLLGREAVADNFYFGHGGNLLCPLDIASGTVSRAAWRDPSSNRLVAVSRHPVTGREIPGFEIPYWQEINALVRRAADVFYLSPVIGWDVAVTPDGPVLIEGNIRWDPSVSTHETWARIRSLSD